MDRFDDLREDKREEIGKDDKNSLIQSINDRLPYYDAKDSSEKFKNELEEDIRHIVGSERIDNMIEKVNENVKSFEEGLTVGEYFFKLNYYENELHDEYINLVDEKGHEYNLYNLLAQSLFMEERGAYKEYSFIVEGQETSISGDTAIKDLFRPDMEFKSAKEAIIKDMYKKFSK